MYDVIMAAFQDELKEISKRAAVPEEIRPIPLRGPIPEQVGPGKSFLGGPTREQMASLFKQAPVGQGAMRKMLGGTAPPVMPQTAAQKMGIVPIPPRGTAMVAPPAGQRPAAVAGAVAGGPFAYAQRGARLAIPSVAAMPAVAGALGGAVRGVRAGVQKAQQTAASMGQTATPGPKITPGGPPSRWRAMTAAERTARPEQFAAIRARLAGKTPAPTGGVGGGPALSAPQAAQATEIVEGLRGQGRPTGQTRATPPPVYKKMSAPAPAAAGFAPGASNATRANLARSRAQFLPR